MSVGSKRKYREEGYEDEKGPRESKGNGALVGGFRREKRGLSGAEILRDIQLRGRPGQSGGQDKERFREGAGRIKEELQLWVQKAPVPILNSLSRQSSERSLQHISRSTCWLHPWRGGCSDRSWLTALASLLLLQAFA